MSIYKMQACFEILPQELKGLQQARYTSVIVCLNRLV